MSPDRPRAGTDHDDTALESSDVELSHPPPGGPGEAQGSDVVPYIVPMFAYVGLGWIESGLPSVIGVNSPYWYPLAYAAKAVLVAFLAWRFRSTWRDFRPRPTIGALVLATGLGLVVWGIWIGLDGLYPPLTFLHGTRVGFDANVLPPAPRWAFVVVRMLGLAVLVPVIEELFWRSFLIRWLINPDFQKIAIGQVTPLPAAVTSVFFALEHPEWLPALVTGLLWAWLLRKTKSLTACVVSHATANLALGVYLIATGEWKYW